MVTASHSKIYWHTGERITQEDLLEFRLLYEGELLSSGNKPKPQNKHAIRKQLNPQLRNLWKIKRNLRQYAGYLGNQVYPHDGTQEERIERGIAHLGSNWARGKYLFVPLVTEQFALRCSVDILLLRPDETQVIHSDGGDLDGKVKTIFDALQIPKSLEGINEPDKDESLFYCLLEDDKLITEVRVVADQLLKLPKDRAPEASDSYFVIHVKINHVGGGPFDRWFD